MPPVAKRALNPQFALSPYISRTDSKVLVDTSLGVELSPELRADLLDLDAWCDILMAYGRSMGVAVALTDAQGHILGKCHNAQPAWKLVRRAAVSWGPACPFCVPTPLPCSAVAEAFQKDGTVIVSDQAGLTHVTVPLRLGNEYLGAIIAGQVFNRYPEPLLLRRVAKQFGISAEQLWEVARRQHPVSSVTLQSSGDLLGALGKAFLRQRYGSILEAKLGESNRYCRSLLEGVRDYALYTIDQVGRVTSWNGAAERMFGYREADIVGQNFSCLFTPEDIHNGLPQKQLQGALQVGQTENEGWRVRANQTQFWASVSITALGEDTEPVRGLAIIMQDRTEQRKVASVLEEAREERACLQDKFLSNITHELRTPLTAIYAFTTNVLDGLLGALTPEQHEHLTLALSSIEQLKGMVSDLLDLTRLDPTKLTIEPQRTSPVKLITEAVSICRSTAATKNINLLIDVPLDSPFVWGDPARLKQSLINLIDCGINFTPDGGNINVEGRLFARDEEFFCVSVYYSGCGISQQDSVTIFDRFAQMKGDAEGSRQGLGLRLFIAKELVSRHGGQIWVGSQSGQNSAFHFTVPVFSLAKWCSHIFTLPNLEMGSVMLIEVRVAARGGTVQGNILPEIRRILERCIQAGRDVLLPPMIDSPGSLETFFIIAFTDSRGLKILTRRIERELQNVEITPSLNPTISSTVLESLPGQSKAKQITEVTARIEQLLQSPEVG